MRPIDLAESDEAAITRLDEFGVKVVPVHWFVPPDARFRPPDDGWCGPKDFIRLHVLGLTGYDAVAFYDNDIQIQGDIAPLLRCASTGKFLSTNGGLEEGMNLGFFALKPRPEILQAARIFDRDSGYDEKFGWSDCGWKPFNQYFVGGECGQGFFHTLFYKANCDPVAKALTAAGATSMFEAQQIDRCVWNYQTSGAGCEDFDCKLVRAHHKPNHNNKDEHGSDPKECQKK